MKWRIVILITILISISQVHQAFSQSPSIQLAQVLQMVPEPTVTMGTSNTVFVEQVLGAKTFLFKELTASVWDTVASSGDPNQSSVAIGGLSDGVTYQYQVLFEGDLSNIVSSTQDNTTPVVTSFFNSSFANTSNVIVPFSVVDSVAQSIKKAEFYYRPAHNSTDNWRLVESRDYFPARVASPGNPFSDSFTFLVPDSLGDGEYEFLIIAQDTAWAPVHRPDQPFAGEEGNITAVNAATPPLLQLFVDTHEPSSEITSQLNPFSKNVSVQVEYHTEDIFLGHDNYNGSGVNQLLFYMNYKTDPGGAYVFTDSLYQTVNFLTPVLEVDGAINFVASQDGFYEFYTIVLDTAQNVENNGLPKLLNLPFVKIDTFLPDVDSIAIQEMPGNENPKTIPKPGWTKNTTVAYQIFGARDIPKDGYQSGLETIELAEDVAFTQNDSSFSFDVGSIAGKYKLTNQPGAKEVFVSVVDRASNTSFPKSDTIIFDPNPPILTQFEVPFFLTAVTEFTADIDASDDFTLDSLYIWRNEILIIRMPLPESGQYQSQLDLEIPDQFGVYYFAAQVRDKAGNLSAVVEDSVKLVNVVTLQKFSFSDLTDTTDSYFGAVPGYSDSMTVSVELTYSSALIKLELSKDPSFSSPDSLFPPWNVTSPTPSDTTIQFEYTFTGSEGEKTLFIRGIGPNETDTSNVVTDSIIIDTTDPVLNQISVYHVVGPADTTFSHTNSRNINVRLNTPETQIVKMVFWETGLDSMLYEDFSTDTTYSLKILDDGQSELNVSIRDLAGNWSVVQKTDVFLDRKPPKLNALSFDNPFSSTFQVNINYDTEDDTTIFGVGLLDRIRFSENNQFPIEDIQQFGLPGEVESSGFFQIDLNPELGEHTVFAQVRDRAGNWGNMLSAQITVVEIVQPTGLNLSDITPQEDFQNASFPGWSNSDSIRAVLTFDGVLKRIVAASDPGFSSNKRDYDEWTTINDSTVSFIYEFDDANNQTSLFVKFIGPNIADTSGVVNSSIVIDKQNPSLDQVSLFQVSAAGDTIYEFANNATVQIRFRNPSEPLSNAFLWEAGGDSVFVSPFGIDENYTFISPDNELKTVFASVRDSAGNWSAEYNDSMILDTAPPSISGFVVSDASTAGIEDSTLTDDFTVEITFTTDDVLPGKLFRVTIAQDENFTNNSQSFKFSTDRIDQSNNQFTLLYETDQQFYNDIRVNCWIVVEDSARNFSAILRDEILFTAPLRITSDLFDVDDPSDNLFSSSNTITLLVNESSGIFEEVAYSETVMGLTNWVPAISGQTFMAEYTFVSSEQFFEGKLYVAARNTAGQFTLDSTTTTVDKIAPQLVSITIRAEVPSGATSFTNELGVSVEIQSTDTGILKEIHLSEDSTFATFERFDVSAQATSSYNESVPFNLSEGNGIKRVFARFLDQSENASLISFDDIIADLDPFSQLSNYPNPFNPNTESTTVVIKSDGSTEIELKIYDLFGNLVRELDVPLGIAYNQIKWDGRNGNGEMVANGGYICVIKIGDDIRMRKIAIIK